MNPIQKCFSDGINDHDRPVSHLASDELLNSGRLESLINAKTVRFLPKEIIYRAGDPADKVYEVKNGLVKLVTYLSNGKQRIVRLHGLHDWLGLAGFLQQSHDHTAIAVTSVETCCISVNDYPLWDAGDIHHYSNLLETLFQHLRKADIWIERFATGCIRVRVANLVNYLSELEYGEGSKRVKLLTCEEMAAILGATTESVSTVLAEFKRNGALRLLDDTFEKQYERAPQLLSY
jgi:CRP/FNR family transcriptional regulator